MLSLVQDMMEGCLYIPTTRAPTNAATRSQRDSSVQYMMQVTYHRPLRYAYMIPIYH
jgi:hypothetical protein